MPGTRGVDRHGHYVRDTHHQHIGTITDALIGAGIDTTRWTGDAIADRITEFRCDRTMPHLASPTAFLRWQLRALADVWTGPTPAERRARIQGERVAIREAELAERAANPPASEETRVSAYAEIRRVLGTRRNATVSNTARRDRFGRRIR